MPTLVSRLGREIKHCSVRITFIIIIIIIITAAAAAACARVYAMSTCQSRPKWPINGQFCDVVQGDRTVDQRRADHHEHSPSRPATAIGLMLFSIAPTYNCFAKYAAINDGVYDKVHIRLCVGRTHLASSGRPGRRNLDREPQLRPGRQQNSDASQRRSYSDVCDVQDHLRSA